MWIGKYVTGNVHEKFEVICGIEVMIEDDVMTKYVVVCTLEEM
jgi:hypothetical protein